MLRRRSQLKKKRRIQFLIVFSLFLLVILLVIFLFKRGKSDISLTLTGENLLSWSQVLSGVAQFELSWAQQVSMLSWNWITESSTSVSNGSWVSSWTVALAEEEEKNHFFSIQNSFGQKLFYLPDSKIIFIFTNKYALISIITLKLILEYCWLYL